MKTQAVIPRHSHSPIRALSGHLSGPVTQIEDKLSRTFQCSFIMISIWLQTSSLPLFRYQAVSSSSSLTKPPASLCLALDSHHLQNLHPPQIPNLNAKSTGILKFSILMQRETRLKHPIKKILPQFFSSSLADYHHHLHYVPLCLSVCLNLHK